MMVYLTDYKINDFIIYLHSEIYVMMSIVDECFWELGIAMTAHARERIWKTNKRIDDMASNL